MTVISSEPEATSSAAGPSPLPPAPGRLFALDVLRGVAVMLVIVRHWPGSYAGMGPFRFLVEIGWSGVDLFFVLSGFLISSLLFKEWDRTGTLRLGRFWLRRGLKIWPAYFAAFGAAMALRCLQLWRQGGVEMAWQEVKRFAPNPLFIQNYFPPDRRWPYTWSVAVEEHFYLALPLLLLAISRVRHREQRPFSLLPWVTLFIAVAALALRVAAVRAGAGWRDVYYPTHLRADSLMFGVLIGYANWYYPDGFRRVCRHWPLLLLVALAALVLPATRPLITSPITYSLGFTVLFLGFGALVALAAAYADFGFRFAPARWTAVVGRYSYTIYLAHGAMELLPRYGRTMSSAGRLGGVWTQRALFIGLAVAGGIILAWLIERPALRLRDRWLPAPRVGRQ